MTPQETISALASPEPRQPALFGWRAAVIVVLTLLAYIPVWRSGFIWDDDIYLTRNRLVKTPTGIFKVWVTHETGDYVPLVSSLMWIEWRMFGMKPAGYHVVNLLLHIATALLVWRVLERLKIPLAWLGALVFALHPVAVATVSWVAETKNTLSAVVYFASILFFLRFEDEKRNTWYALALITFVFGMFAKGSVVILPPVLLLCIWWLRSRITWRDMLRTAPFFLLSAVFSGVTIFVQYRLPESQETTLPPIPQRVTIAATNAWFYLRKAVLPMELNVIYPLWKTAPGYIPLAVGLAVFVIAWIFRRSWGRPILFGLGYFLLALLPVLGFFKIALFRIAPVADHFQYLALPGVTALVVGSMAVILKRLKNPHVAPVLTLLAVTILFVFTYRRAEIYQSAETLWLDALTKNPDSPTAHNNYGQQLMRRERYTEARDHFAAAVRLDPTFPQPQDNLGMALARLGDWDQAAVHVKESIRLRPNAGRYNNYGFILQHSSRPDDAIAAYKKAIELDPDYADPHFNLSDLYSRQRKWNDAIAEQRISIQLGNDSAYHHYFLGILLEKVGQFKEAAKEYAEAVRKDPNAAAARARMRAIEEPP